MKRSALNVSFIAGISTLFQIVTQIVVTRIFGAKLNLDIFLAAVALPTVVVSVIYGTLSDTFIPLVKQKKPNQAISYVFSTACGLGIISLVFSIILYLFAKNIVILFFGARDNNFITQTTLYFKYMIFIIPPSPVITIFGSYLYSQKKFILFPFAQLIGTIANLLFIYVFAHQLGVMSLIIGFFISNLIPLPFVFPYKNLNILSLFNFKVSKLAIFDVFMIFISWLPLIISSFALNTGTLIMRSFSANLKEGYIVYVNLASKLFSAGVGVATIGISTIFLPHLVDLLHSKETDRIKRQVFTAKLAAWVVSSAVIAFILLTAPFFMRLILVGGKFSRSNVDHLISIFPYFIVPAIGWGISQIYFQPLIAMRKQHILTILNICAAVLAWLSALLTKKFFGDLNAITVGLTILLFVGIIGAEVLWRIELKKEVAKNQS